MQTLPHDVEMLLNSMDILQKDIKWVCILAIIWQLIQQCLAWFSWLNLSLKLLYSSTAVSNSCLVATWLLYITALNFLFHPILYSANSAILHPWGIVTYSHSWWKPMASEFTLPEKLYTLHFNDERALKVTWNHCSSPLKC